jgi:hypothetical protein
MLYVPSPCASALHPRHRSACELVAPLLSQTLYACPFWPGGGRAKRRLQCLDKEAVAEISLRLYSYLVFGSSHALTTAGGGSAKRRRFSQVDSVAAEAGLGPLCVRVYFMIRTEAVTEKPLQFC